MLTSTLTLARGPRVPKRLLEAAVGAVLRETAPSASLWASTFRSADGLGVVPRADRLLLQCSPAETRVAGFSTRLSTRTLATYCKHPELIAWGGRAQFVLLARPPDSVTEEHERLEHCLWAAPAPALYDFTMSQGRGTVNQAALAWLLAEGVAKPLRQIIVDAESSAVDLPTGSPATSRFAEEEDSDDWLLGYRFNFHMPTPLGVSFAA